MTQTTQQRGRKPMAMATPPAKARFPSRLLEVTEPLFQYMCRLNRSARKGGDQDQSQVRHEILTLLTELKQKAQADPSLTIHFHRQSGNLMLVLIFFIDFTIRNSSLRFAADWVNLAEAERESNGDEVFFDMLDSTLADRSEAATERLAVYYTCMGLGFTGFYTGQPDFLRRKMLECAAQMRLRQGDDSGKICPDAYENVDTSDLNASTGTTLVGWFIALAALVVMLLVVNVYLYYRSSSDLDGALEKISKTKAPIVSAAPGGSGGQ